MAYYVAAQLERNRKSWNIPASDVGKVMIVSRFPFVTFSGLKDEDGNWLEFSIKDYHAHFLYKES